MAAELAGALCGGVTRWMRGRPRRRRGEASIVVEARAPARHAATTRPGDPRGAIALRRAGRSTAQRSRWSAVRADRLDGDRVRRDARANGRASVRGARGLGARARSGRSTRGRGGPDPRWMRGRVDACGRAPPHRAGGGGAGRRARSGDRGRDEPVSVRARGRLTFRYRSSSSLADGRARARTRRGAATAVTSGIASPRRARSASPRRSRSSRARGWRRTSSRRWWS